MIRQIESLGSMSVDFSGIGLHLGKVDNHCDGWTYRDHALCLAWRVFRFRTWRKQKKPKGKLMSAPHKPMHPAVRLAGIAAVILAGVALGYLAAGLILIAVLFWLKIR